jgi:multimeric flavodoxin WrbA
MCPSKRILFLNGSIRGAHGNTASLLEAARRLLPDDVEARDVVLASYQGTVEELAAELRAADGLVIGTGVYWGSWGSPFQRFLEIMTAFEVSDLFVGKAAGVIVSMDSVGGSDVAHRLVGVLATLGCLIPPLGMVVVSRIGVEVKDAPGNGDVWQVEDLESLMKNLVIGTSLARLPWQEWPVVRLNPVSGAYPASGILELGAPLFTSVRENP